MPTNFRIEQEPLGLPVIANEPMVRPKDLLAISFMPGEDSLPLQGPILRRRIGKVWSVQTYELDCREPDSGEPLRIACVMNYNGVNRQSLGIEFSRSASERKVSRRQMEFEEVVELPLASRSRGPGLVFNLTKKALDLRNHSEVPRRV